MDKITEVTQQAIDYSQRIPNNVDLSTDRTLQRALEQWQPGFLNWWNETGPVDTSTLQVYLRTAVSVDRDGWANFDYVRMPEYRWGIFLTPKDENRKVNFGDHKGEPAWQDVPGEYRGELRRLIAQDFTEAFKQCDVIMGPTSPSTAFKIGEKLDDPLAMYLNDIATIPVNLAGLGSMSLPAGLADEDGLPVGFQITAPVMKDDLLYQVGGVLEAALPSKWGAPLLSKVAL